MPQLYKYELTLDAVKYLQSAVNSLQIRGEQQADDMLKVLQLLRNPVNLEEIKENQKKAEEEAKEAEKQE